MIVNSHRVLLLATSLGLVTGPIPGGLLSYLRREGLPHPIPHLNLSIRRGPQAMDYGLLEFGVRDPNRYLLAFSEPAD